MTLKTSTAITLTTCTQDLWQYLARELGGEDQEGVESLAGAIRARSFSPSLFLFLSLYLYTHIYIYIHTHIYIYIYIYICMPIHIYMYIHCHTETDLWQYLARELGGEDQGGGESLAGAVRAWSLSLYISLSVSLFLSVSIYLSLSLSLSQRQHKLAASEHEKDQWSL